MRGGRGRCGIRREGGGEQGGEGKKHHTNSSSVYGKGDGKERKSKCEKKYSGRGRGGKDVAFMERGKEEME